MNRLRFSLLVVAVLTAMLGWSVAGGMRDRQELAKVTAANQVLRQSLGDMAKALSAKEKEIDRLEQAGCGR